MVYRGVSLGGIRNPEREYHPLTNPFEPAGTVIDPGIAPPGLAERVRELVMQTGFGLPYLPMPLIVRILNEFPVPTDAHRPEVAVVSNTKPERR